MIRDFFVFMGPVFVFYDYSVLIYFLILNSFYLLSYLRVEERNMLGGCDESAIRSASDAYEQTFAHPPQ